MQIMLTFSLFDNSYNNNNIIHSNLLFTKNFLTTACSHLAQKDELNTESNT